ncbi:uncharacterized protein N7483_006611 [Penicillium malachiteum]|uniref:uncharacterized protein n=1 Tax=Penicillium malachiteum TaxID=1324776 RepID=UPI002546C206|nr:uncharacterized protein N7483_006611 [Penicillium malachiteum]KAJ5725254.1 hypothetical protein N7483_006611 [Penicillium malachiteum]
MRSGESSFIMGLEGSEIVTPAHPNLELSERTRIITKNLEEVSLSMPRHVHVDPIIPDFTTEKDLELPERTWIITKKLEEVSLSMHKQDHEDPIGLDFAAGKFLCYLKGDEHQKPAFLRIYRQIPIIGTEWCPPNERASQAVPFHEPTELLALKSFMKQMCPVVPQLFGYNHTQQPDTGMIPGGYEAVFV